METIVEGEPCQRVLNLCDRVGLSRTTFYKHFESMEDLDQRFLRVYAHLTLADVVRPVGDPDLGTYLAAVVGAQAAAEGFFRQVFGEPTWGPYRLRWFEAVEALAPKAPAHDQLDPELEAFHRHLALGVVRRFLEASLGPRKDTLALTLEYLRGGYAQLVSTQGPQRVSPLTSPRETRVT
jgi:AcrR family transcriptional regulator